jgi:hypothetical protein
MVGLTWNRTVTGKQDLQISVLAEFFYFCFAAVFNGFGTLKILGDSFVDQRCNHLIITACITNFFLHVFYLSCGPELF